MASKEHHHFVPRFYLVNFKSGTDKQINVYVINGKHIHLDASIRGQCQRRRLYGSTDEVENALGDIEGMLSASIRHVVASMQINTQEEERNLKCFLLLQSLRTPMVTESALDKGRKVQEIVGLEINQMSTLEATLMQLSLLKTLLPTVRSLGIKLVVADSGRRFFTSDNPTFKYNLYCERARGVGLSGFQQSGFIMFTPLSPRLLTIVYDKEVYKMPREVCLATGKDVDALNAMQSGPWFEPRGWYSQ